jgi:DHA1 family inner membrane transport protein
MYDRTMPESQFIPNVTGAAHAASFLANHVRVITAAPASREDFATLPNVSVFNTGIGLGAIIGGKVIDLAGLQFVGLVAAVLAGCAIALELAPARSKQLAERALVKEHT